MKKLIYGISFLALVGIIVVSCNKERLSPTIPQENINEETSSQRFNYDVYNERESLYTTLGEIDLNQIKSNNEKLVNLVPLQNALDIINAQYDTNIPINNFDIYQIENPNATYDDYLELGFISVQEHSIIDFFLTNVQTNSFKTAINDLENHIISLELIEEDIVKYNDYVNMLMIIDDYYTQKGINIWHSTGGNKAMSGGCATALASNAAATISLYACLVPGPWCPLAIVSKGLSLMGIYFSC